MAIIIRAAELIARYFWFLSEFVKIFYFLDCPLRILGGFTWRLQKEPPISKDFDSDLGFILTFYYNISLDNIYENLGGYFILFYNGISE